MSEQKAEYIINRHNVFRRTNGNCYYCGHTLVFDYIGAGNSRYMFTIDHIVPKISGGNDSPENLVPCCKFCNSSKRGRSLEEWRTVRQRIVNEVPIFSDEQIEYLSSIDIYLPELPEYRFWFEENNL